MVTLTQVLDTIYGPTTAYASWEIATAQRVLALFEPVAPKPLQVGDMLRTKQDYENAPIGTKVEPFWTKRSDGKWHSQDGSGYKSSRMSYRPRTVVRVGCGYAEGDTLEGAEAAVGRVRAYLLDPMSYLTIGDLRLAPVEAVLRHLDGE